jgi:hypothetical protein
MALQFFAVHSEALATTHEALQRHASSQGLRPPGPTRALRIAQLYGHLQLRAAGRSSLALALSELAASWRFQPRQLRQDLALLQALGWLSARGTTRGTVISLSGPEPADRGEGEPAQEAPEAGLEALEAAQDALEAVQIAPAAQEAPEAAQKPRGQAVRLPAVRERTATRLALPAPAAPRSDLQARGAPLAALAEREAPHPALPQPAPPQPAPPQPAPQPAPAAQLESVSPGHVPTPPQASATPQADASPDLLQRLAGLYNQHRPATWPAYQPRGNGLRSKLRQALRQAGSADALADTLTVALGAMPPFWRTTYPQGRSGSECMAALFSTDRGCAGLGVEFWHVFSWAQAALQGSGEAGGDRSCSGAGAAAADGAATAAADPAAALQRARRLFLWDSGVWRGQGREALLLSQPQKRELAQLLEANGLGIPGTAEQQFADPEPDPAPVQAPAPPQAAAPFPVPLEVSTAANGRAGESQAGGEQKGGPQAVGEQEVWKQAADPQAAQPAKAQAAPPEPRQGPPRQARPRADQPSAPPTASPSSGPAPPSRRSRRRRPGHPNAAPQHQPGGP